MNGRTGETGPDADELREELKANLDFCNDCGAVLVPNHEKKHVCQTN